MGYTDDLQAAIASKERDQEQLLQQLAPLREQLRWLARNEKTVNARALDIMRGWSDQSGQAVERALAEAAQSAWTEELARRDAAAKEAMQTSESVPEEGAADADE